MTRVFTVGQLAKRFGQPEWKIRRVVDSLDGNVPRIGPYRAIPAKMLPAIRERLAEQTVGVAQ
jgi:hypothetical protein